MPTNPARRQQHAAPWIAGHARLVEFLGLVLGPDYEVALHDLGLPDRSIVAIANGHVSGRTLGAPLSSLALQAIVNHSRETPDSRLNYAGIAAGRLLRSSTFFITDESGTQVGLLCINFDDSRYRELSDRILKLRHPDIFVDSNFAYDDGIGTVTAAPDAARVQPLSESLSAPTEALLRRTLAAFAGPGERLTRTKRNQAIRELHDRGFFRIKGAVRDAARALSCSQATLYRHLARIEDGDFPEQRIATQ
jgi:predicted transcriptional regulator YheO